MLTWLFSLFLALAGLVAQAAGDTKAAELIAKARAAIGGDANLSKVLGLSCAGTLQRAVGDRQVSGELTIDLQLPDKLLRSESVSPLGDVTLVTEQGINGDKLLRSSKMLNAPPGAVIRTPPPPAAGSDAEAQALRNSRAELVRLAIAMLLSPPSSLPVEFSYGGEAEAPDGKADVVDAKGAGSFAVRLFFDKASHRPLMVSYRGVAPRMVVQTQTGDAPPRSGHGDAPAAEVRPAQEQVEITLFLDDYRDTGGVLLPHHIVRSVGGQTNEEWTFKTIKVNPAFKPDTFNR